MVQETWLGVIRGLDRFEGRSSLRTWIFSILINTAKTRGKQERRTIPFSVAAGAQDDDEPLLDPERFLPADSEVWAGHWAIAPSRWETPEERLLAGELREVVMRAIEELPPAQREVITMRDIHGWSSQEVCDALSISSGNQRVLLHRARTKVRLAVETELGAVERAPSSPEEAAALAAEASASA